MKKLKLILIVYFVLAFQFVFAQQLTLKFIETSDLHGAIYPFDFINDKPAKASMAQIYTYVKQERAKFRDIHRRKCSGRGGFILMVMRWKKQRY